MTEWPAVVWWFYLSCLVFLVGGLLFVAALFSGSYWVSLGGTILMAIGSTGAALALLSEEDRRG